MSQSRRITSLESYKSTQWSDFFRHTTGDLAAQYGKYHADYALDNWYNRQRDFFVMYLILGGQAHQIINGHPYAMTAGDVYLIPPGYIHGHHDAEHLEVEELYFRSAIFRGEDLKMLRSSPGFAPLLRAHSKASLTDCDFRLRLTPECFARARDWSQQIREELARHDTNSTLIARGMFFRLIGSLMRWSAEAEPTPRPSPLKDGQPVAAALRFCEENFHEPLLIPQLAARMFISPSHLYALFKAEVGVTPATYIRRLRLSHAQLLLRTTSQSSGDIAAACGFREVSQFSRAFRAAFGTTPREYRRAYFGTAAK